MHCQYPVLFVAFILTICVTLEFTPSLVSADDPSGKQTTSSNDTQASNDADQPTSKAGEDDAGRDDASKDDASKDDADQDDAQSVQPAPEVVAAIQAGPRALSLAFRMAAKRATQSVVVVRSFGQGSQQPNDDTEKDNPEDDLPLLERAEVPSPPPSPGKLTGLGSGMVIGKDGLVLTNNHVIAGAKRVEVQLPDGTRVDAEFMCGDADSDVGIVRIPELEQLVPVQLGDSDNLEIGDWVLAIGSPFKLEATVSAGIISGKNRSIERIPRSSMLQTDAAINPGNSGGPLIDLDGKVVGISTAIATRSGFYQGVGFAIPINQARWIANELDEHQEVRRAAIGTTLVDLKPHIAEKFGLEPHSGILVYQVIKDSVAERAGIKAGDVIIKFDGKRVRDSAALQAEIERKAIGSMQPIVVQRKGESVDLEVELATVDDPTGGARDAKAQ